MSRGSSHVDTKPGRREYSLKYMLHVVPPKSLHSINFHVNGASNDKNKGHMFSYTSKKLLDTQHTYSVNSSMIRCAENKEIEDDCELPSDFTWQKWKKKERIQLVIDESQDHPNWQYVLLEENEEKIWEFKEKRKKGLAFDITQYGQVLEYGLGKEPPNELKHEFERVYSINITL